MREIRAPLRLEKLVSVLAREIPPSEGRRREEVTPLFNELHQNILEILPEGEAKRALDTAYARYDKVRKRFDREGRLRAQTALNKLDSVILAYELMEDRDKSLFSSHGVIKSADAFIDAMQNKKGGLPIPFEDFEQQDEALSSLMRNKEDRYSAQGFEQLDEDVKSVLRKEAGRYSEHFLRMVEKKRRELRGALTMRRKVPICRGCKPM